MSAAVSSTPSKKGAKTRTKGSRPATYGGATRLARLIHGLHARPTGWSFDAIQDELGVSERTLLRYVAACRRELVDAEERPMLEVVRRGENRVLHLTRPDRPPDLNVFKALFLYFALSVFDFLEGTVLKEGVEDLWSRFVRALPGAQQVRLADFRKKFYSIPYAVKDYRAFDDVLDTIVQCLVYERRMRIEYTRPGGEPKVHDFEPYTLAMYKGGLYLIGKSHRGSKIIYLAVERIRKAEKLDERFVYPRGYSPEKHTEGMFGIIGGPETRVELLIRNPETVSYVASRRIHPTQQLVNRSDGGAVLTMQVRGIDELPAWILSLGPYVEVWRPRELREAVGRQLAEAARLYQARDAST